MFNNLSLVLTSCNRLDLLEKTVSSIPQHLLDQIPSKILVDDSVDEECYSKIINNSFFENWLLIFNTKKMGQPASIDRAYANVHTDYVFHCEDDWGFEDYDFITPSLNILEKYDNLVQVTFRKDSPHMAFDEVYESGTENAFKVLIPDYNGWPGFTYNPNIFRFSAYKKLVSCKGKTEKDVGLFYKEQGLYTAALERRVVYHLGDGRHVYDYVNGV